MSHMPPASCGPDWFILSFIPSSLVTRALRLLLLKAGVTGMDLDTAVRGDCSGRPVFNGLFFRLKWVTVRSENTRPVLQK